MSESFVARNALKLVVVAGLTAPLALAIGLAWAKFQPEEKEPEAAPIDLAAKASCAENLKRIGIALNQYREKHAAYPPAFVADADGKPQHSWRVLLLPFLDQQPLYDRYRFDEPWDGPNNTALLSERPGVFGCAPATADAPPGDPTHTKFVAVVGERTAFRGATGTTPEQITDDPGSTALLVQLPDGGVPWSSPENLAFDQLGLTLAARKAQGDAVREIRGGSVLLQNETVKELPADLPVGTLRTLLETQDGKQVEF